MKTKIALRLFISGQSRTAMRAIDNLKAVCDDPVVKRRYDLSVDIIDINESPQIAEEDRVLVTPTLLKKLPPPIRRVVGDLSDTQDILMTLDIDSSGREDSKADVGNP